MDLPTSVLTRTGLYRSSLKQLYVILLASIEILLTLGLKPGESMDHPQSLSSTPQATPRPMTPMSLSMGSPHMLGSDSTKRKRSDGSKLASVEMHEQAGSYLSPQSVRAPSPSKDQGRPPVHPSKKPRHSAGLDPDTEMSNARAEPPPWTHTYDHPSSNVNPVGSPEVISPTRSPDPENEMDLDVSSKEQETDPTSHQQQYPAPSPQSQQRISPLPQQTQNQQAESQPKPQATSALITGSGSHAWTEEDRNLIEQLRSQMSKEPGYNEFLEFRNKKLTMREQLTQYAYITKHLEEHTRGGSDVKKVCIGSSVSRELGSLCLVVDACDGRFQLTRIVGGYGAGDPRTVRALWSWGIRVRRRQNRRYDGRNSPRHRKDPGIKVLGSPASPPPRAERRLRWGMFSLSLGATCLCI